MWDNRVADGISRIGACVSDTIADTKYSAHVKGTGRPLPQRFHTRITEALEVLKLDKTLEHFWKYSSVTLEFKGNQVIINLTSSLAYNFRGALVFTID